MRSFLLFFFTVIATAPTFAMTGIEGLRWAQTPNEVLQAWQGRYELAQQPEDPLGKVLYELRFKGNFLGTYDDGVISVIFYLNRLFAVTVAYGSNDTRPATAVFEALITIMAKRFGPFTSRSYPQEIHSFVAMKGIPPISEMPGGKDQLIDLQIRTGFWIPEATWTYPNGASIRILVSKGAEATGKMAALSPLLIFSKTNILD